MAEAPAKLQALQERFFRLISSPLPVDEAAREQSRQDHEVLAPERWIVASSREAAFTRLAIYANMYFHRLLGVLRHDFPIVQAAAGKTAFHNLIVDYLAAHPSTDPSVRHLGRHLPGFVARHALADRLPFLGALAALEWARGDLIDAADATHLTSGELAALPPNAWPELRLALVPAHVLLRVDYPVHRLWQAAQRDETTPGQAHALAELLPELAPEATCIAVWRQGFTVHHRVVDAEEMRALERLEGGAVLAELAESIEAAGALDDAGLALARWLRRWADLGLLALQDRSRR